MTSSPPLSTESILSAMRTVGSGHASISRGALPFVLPTRVAVHGPDARADVVLLSDHPTVLAGVRRHDIAALQVDAEIDGVWWSLHVTGPLSGSVHGPVIRHDEAMFAAECLSSPHGHGTDGLLRGGFHRAG